MGAGEQRWPWLKQSARLNRTGFCSMGRKWSGGLCVRPGPRSCALRWGATAFISNQRAWIAEQLMRVRGLHALRRPLVRHCKQTLFRGNAVVVRVVRSETWCRPNKVAIEQGAITVICGPGSKTAPARSLENWLRKQARERIDWHIADVSRRLNRVPNRIYVMGQRTKWGNCSALGNLSFNWRLVMAPDFVLRYIVTHGRCRACAPRQNGLGIGW